MLLILFAAALVLPWFDDTGEADQLQCASLLLVLKTCNETECDRQDLLVYRIRSRYQRYMRTKKKTETKCSTGHSPTK